MEKDFIRNSTRVQKLPSIFNLFTYMCMRWRFTLIINPSKWERFQQKALIICMLKVYIEKYGVEK